MTKEIYYYNSGKFILKYERNVFPQTRENMHGKIYNVHDKKIRQFISYSNNKN